MSLYHQPRQTPAERAAQLQREHRAHVARQRRRWLARAGGVIGSLGAGLVLMAWALHTTDAGWAGIAFWGGLLVGNAGILVTLVVSYLRALEAGDL